MARARSAAWCSACTALNRFLHDIYHEQEILKAGIDPGRAGRSATRSTAPRCMGVDVPGGIYCAHRRHRHRARRRSGEYYVLEDNLRVPSGVSYMLENRKMMMRLFPELFARTASRRSRTTPTCCSRPCARSRRAARDDPTVVRAHAGHVQQRLLRARVPRAADGRRAGRGPGPVRRGRLRLHAHDARPAAGRRDLPPRRRRLPRPARRSAPTRRSACRACSTPTAPATSRSPTRSAPASPTTSRSTRTCRR